MPEKQSKEKTTATKRKFFDQYNRPPVTRDPCMDKEKIYDWAFIDGSLEIVEKGYRDPDADIQAAKQETLTEMLDRMAGRTPLEKVRNAVDAGLFVGNEPGTDAKFVDLTGIPTSIVDAHAALSKGEAAAASLPSDFTKGETDLSKILDLFTEDQLKAYLDSKKPAETPKGDNE